MFIVLIYRIFNSGNKNWIRLAVETVRWRALVNTAMNFYLNNTKRIPFIATGLSLFK
jgi:hypothetical protein